jgi:hypothetical protein
MNVLKISGKNKNVMIKQTKEKQTNTPTLSSEELTEFKQIQESYQTAIFDLGMLDLAIHDAGVRLDELKSEKLTILSHIRTIVDKQQEISNKLGDKYGDKKVNLETGELM